MTLDNFLEKVDTLTSELQREVEVRATQMEITALHAKYLGSNGVLQTTLKSFSPTNSTDGKLSKHAIQKARQDISDACVRRITSIARENRLKAFPSQKETEMVSARNA